MPIGSSRHQQGKPTRTRWHDDAPEMKDRLWQLFFGLLLGFVLISSTGDAERGAGRRSAGRGRPVRAAAGRRGPRQVRRRPRHLRAAVAPPPPPPPPPCAAATAAAAVPPHLHRPILLLFNTSPEK